MDYHSAAEWLLFFDKWPKWAPRGSRPPKRHQNRAQGCQNGAPRPPILRFWAQKSYQKGARVLSLQMAKQDRNGWYQHTNTQPTNRTTTQFHSTLHISTPRCMSTCIGRVPHSFGPQPVLHHTAETLVEPSHDALSRHTLGGGKRGWWVGEAKPVTGFSLAHLGPKVKKQKSKENMAAMNMSCTYPAQA